MSFYGGLSSEHLQQYIERVERLEEEKSNIANDIRDVFAEAKGNGFDVKTMRQIVKLRKMDGNDIEEQEHLLDIYKRALGMIPELDDEPVSTASATAAAYTPKATEETAETTEEEKAEEAA